MKKKRDLHSVKEVKSTYDIGKEITPELRKKLNKNIVDSRAKELDILNTIGSSAEQERHYPKSFIIGKDKK